MLTPAQRGLLSAIAHSDDPSVSPRDRLDAIKTLAEHPEEGEAAELALALSIIRMSPEEVAAEAAAMFAQVPAEWAEG
jgi:hypothetical protein